VILRGAAQAVIRRTLAAAARLGEGRLLCIDGPAGSGKTTLAATVLDAVPPGMTAGAVHMDDVYPGWSGLAEGVDRVARLLLEPMSRGEPGGFRRYDWHAGREAEWHEVPRVDLLVVEGVGAGAAAYQHLISTLVWVEAPRELRLRRGLDRDGEGVRDHWLRWTADEDTWHERDRTRDRADLVLDGTADVSTQ
jgi:energy-coupling factor transporter ATP-binding protein EcfA2